MQNGKEVPAQYDIQPSSEDGFNLNTCFMNVDKMQGYEMSQDYYFDSYSHLNIHEEMLKDEHRTNSYRKAIQQNKHLFQDKIVLDVGCGTGILSIFAAQAGAKQVYAIDNSHIAKQAKQIIEENKLTDKITVIQGKMEEIVLPVEKVDIIISEWMGYFLLYESMLDCILVARDKYLKPNGLLFPDRAVLFLASLEDEQYREEKINFWDNVYGVSMKCVKKWALRYPLVDNIEAKYINSQPTAILDIDLQTVKLTDLDFVNTYKLKVKKNDIIHAFVSWFDVHFSHCHIPVVLTTSPYYNTTHWKQTVLYLEEPISVHQDDIIEGSIAVKKSQKNPRNLDIKLSIHLQNKLKNVDQINFYVMN